MIKIFLTSSFGTSDKGKVRETNEDYLCFYDDGMGSLPNLYAISDGMGGHKAGQIASKLSLISFADYIVKNNINDQNEILDFLVDATKFANKNVYEKSLSDKNCEGMGATLSACTVFENRLYAVHVGDSRIYLINKSGINQLTTDHTYINEMVKTGKLTQSQAKHHPQKNIITRAVGISENIEVDAFIKQCEPDDLIMICSDGLTSMLDDQEIFDFIKKEFSKKNQEQKNNPDNNLDSSDILENIVLNCIEKANQKGGYDNISMILVKLFSGVMTE